MKNSINKKSKKIINSRNKQFEEKTPSFPSTENFSP
jgi:hypothetical protein